MAKPATQSTPPIERSVVVPCAPARAFQAFTAEIAQWWPMASHSVGQEKTQAVAIEPRIGGRIFETQQDGTQSDWGEVLTWSPPGQFSMTWHPGRDPKTQQVVELRFAADKAGGTRVTLRHHGWEKLGAAAAKAHDSYQSGWKTVLAGHFSAYCKRIA